MKNKIIYISSLFLASSLVTFGQEDKVKFGAVSRGIIQENTLEKDTVNPYRENTSNALVDLRVNINPNKKTEIGTVIRFQGALGGFYGAGANIELRQLFLKGTIYNKVNYEFGDIYLQLSPYTLFNNDAEGNVNEASVFAKIRKDYSQYDNFNIGNTWWSQGGHVDFGFFLDSANSKGINFDVFSTRVKAPTTMRFLNGARVSLFQEKVAKLNLNLVQLADAQSVNPLQEGIQNNVATLEGEYNLPVSTMKLTFSGELGASTYQVLKPADSPINYITPDKKEGSFVTLKANAAVLKNKLNFGVRYLRNSVDFLSAGAQSKRINYASNPTLFQNVANDPFNSRDNQLYDLLASPTIYNPQISNTLMAYNPRFGNALPYGMATPNRTGVIVNASYIDSAKVVDLKLDFGLLSDLTGVGTTEMRKFTHIKYQGDLYLNKLLGFKKALKITSGVLYNNTTRGGNVAAVDLKTIHLDAGLDAEIFSNLYVLFGYKQLQSKGNEFIYDFSNHNEYSIPRFFSMDDKDSMLALGARYHFTENMYLSINHTAVNTTNNLVPNRAYAFNQWMLLFSLKM
jgi:hypothetical protein